MSTATKALLGIGGLAVLFALIGLGAVIGINNNCVQQEAGLEAQYKQDQNNYANYFDKIKEMAQVPEMYAADLQKTYDGAMKGRYGSDGSKAVFQFIQEHNPTIDVAMYTRLQQSMEAGRNSFEADQKTLLDKKRVYVAMLDQFPDGSGGEVRITKSAMLCAIEALPDPPLGAQLYVETGGAYEFAVRSVCQSTELPGDPELGERAELPYANEIAIHHKPVVVLNTARIGWKVELRPIPWPSEGK